MDMINKSLLLKSEGALITRDMLAEATEHMVRAGKLSAEDVKALADELLGGGRHVWRELEREVRQAAQKGVATVSLGYEKELDHLKQRLAKLEETVNKLSTSRGNGRFARG